MSGRVGDFGIWKILPDDTGQTLLSSISFAGLRGSIGYVAPGNRNSTHIVFTLWVFTCRLSNLTYLVKIYIKDSTNQVKPMKFKKLNTWQGFCFMISQKIRTLCDA
jgi:hypothetical protein